VVAKLNASTPVVSKPTNVHDNEPVPSTFQNSSNPTSSHVVAKQEEFGEGNDEFGLTKYLCSYFEVTFYMS
jgi:hypothetical protein